MTRLQETVRALRDLRVDALDGLDDREFEAFVAVGCEVFAAEAGRLLTGRLLRAERVSSEEPSP